MLHSHFFETAASCIDSPALWVKDRLYSYGDIQTRARRISAGLTAIGQRNDIGRCLLFAYRSVEAYAGVLGILDAGMAYVPLSPKAPPSRMATIIAQSGAPLMLVDRRCASGLEDVLALLDAPPQIFLIDEDASGTPLPSFASTLTTLPSVPYVRRPGTEHDVAYILFTSGSTGTPKGVPITHANANAYVKGQLQLHERTDNARHIQLCELSFDPSVHDMFVCWATGGCLYVPETVDPVYNADFIRRYGITHWSSVPSVVGFMQQMRKLTPGAFPSLRVSMFGGEQLPRSLALAWMRAAPHSKLFNMYGPTEATIASTCFEVSADFIDTPQHTVIPLGRALPGVELMIVDADLRPVAAEQTGELLIAGPQITEGYLSADSRLGNDRFVSKSFPGRLAQRWYRTGDIVRTTGELGIVFHGRVDTQVKVRGNRVELEEVEHIVHASSGAALCAVIAWPLDEVGRAAGLVAFVTNPRVDTEAVLHACRQRLPDYAAPQRIVSLDAMPLNANGKIDRKALVEQCARTMIPA
ncbi:amino acid adenylation domain-containing protein [Cupriavidus plantarum]|uniref:amino acid adenylation domain-containing protein n=1 Tax=Cupriavidus plantarum TaxID=942865 RepID=UPI000E270501|nr:amino acid adenylation domain-containing protein [Cupriavidus plantarum]REE89209.1 amino acid adenylation domain-containing protein [Cupriavidus plantarum]RLK31770.1 amino acid adenylation domain-containing protein [Cupriavidus plantarum]